MDRETKIVTSPSGHKVELKTYITGRELEAIENVLYNGIKTSAIIDNELNKKASVKLDTENFLIEQTHKTIEMVIVSIDEQKENIVERTLDLKKDDYIFIIAEIEKVTNDKVEKKKL